MTKSRWPNWLRRWAIPAKEARRMQQENHVLRDALREANAELAKHRVLVYRLSTGCEQTTEVFERVIAKQ